MPLLGKDRETNTKVILHNKITRAEGGTVSKQSASQGVSGEIISEYHRREQRKKGKPMSKDMSLKFLTGKLELTLT